MSFSFSVQATTREAAKAQIEAKLTEVVDAQPLHALDRAYVEQAAHSALNTVADPAEDEEFYVSVSGSLSWRGQLAEDPVITGSSLSVSVSRLVKTTKA